MAKFGKGVTTSALVIQHGAELEGWKKFIKRFEVALIGAGMQKTEKSGNKSGRGRSEGDKTEERESKFQMEQRKAALLLDCTGDVEMEIFETWDIEVSRMQYDPLRKAFNDHFAAKENIVATRHRFFSQEQRQGETIDKYIERLERAGRTCRFGGILDELILQMIIRGMSEDRLRKELLLKRNLDLGEAKEVCTQYESAVAASKIIRGRAELSEVDRVEEEKGQGKIDRLGARPFDVKKYGGRESKRFTCGKPGHFARECKDRNRARTKPALKKYYNCGVAGHFARVSEVEGTTGGKDVSKRSIWIRTHRVRINCD